MYLLYPISQSTVVFKGFLQQVNNWSLQASTLQHFKENGQVSNRREK